MSDKCPKCEYKRLKTWGELSDDERMAVKVIHSDFPLEQRKKHRFCLRCWFEEVQNEGKA